MSRIVVYNGNTKLGELSSGSTMNPTQQSAINSGITADKVATYDGYATTLASKADKGDVKDTTITISVYGTPQTFTLNQATAKTITIAEPVMEVERI